MYYPQQKSSKNNLKVMKNDKISQRNGKTDLNPAIFEMDIFYAPTRNITFGIGQNWIRCSASKHQILGYQLQILFLLLINYPQSKVSNVNLIIANFKKEMKKFVSLRSTQCMLQSELGWKSMLEQIQEMLMRIVEKKNVQNLSNKLGSLCKLINQHNLCHKIINAYICSKVSQNNLDNLNTSLGVNFSIHNNGIQISLNNMLQTEYKVGQYGEASIRVDVQNGKQKQIKKVQRLIRKSTTRSVGKLSEDEEECFIEQVSHFNTITEFHNLLYNDSPHESNANKFKKTRQALQSTSVQESDIQDKEEGVKKSLSIRKQYDLTIKPIIFKKIQPSLELNSKMPKFLKERKQLKRFASRGDLHSPTSKFSLLLKDHVKKFI